MSTESFIKTRKDCHGNYVIFERVSHDAWGKPRGSKVGGYQITTYAPHSPGGTVKIGLIHPIGKKGKAKANAEFNREVRVFLDKTCKRRDVK